MAYITKRGDKWRAEVCIDRKRESKTFILKRDAVLWAADKEQVGILSRRTLRVDVECSLTPLECINQLLIHGLGRDGTGEEWSSMRKVRRKRPREPVRPSSSLVDVGNQLLPLQLSQFGRQFFHPSIRCTGGLL